MRCLLAFLFALTVTFIAPCSVFPREFDSWQLLNNATFTATTDIGDVELKIHAMDIYRSQSHEKHRSTYRLVPTKWTAVQSGTWKYDQFEGPVSYEPNWRHHYEFEYKLNHRESMTVDFDKLPDAPTWKTGIEIIIVDESRSDGPISYTVLYYGLRDNVASIYRPYLMLDFEHSSQWQRKGRLFSIDSEGNVTSSEVEPLKALAYDNIPTLTIGAKTKSSRRLIRNYGGGQVPNWSWNHDPHLRYLPTLDWNHLHAVGEFSLPIKQKPSNSSSGGFGDSYVHSNWELKIGGPFDEPTLSPDDEGEMEWLPQPGDVRHYKLVLDDPGRYEKVRFLLEDVSDYRGVATNAGNHKRHANRCQDCNCVQEHLEIEVISQFNKHPISRKYQKYGDCPLDSMPDVYFDTLLNPLFEPAGKKYSEDLRSEKCLELLLDAPQEGEYLVAVTAMDFAASGRLRAEVMVNGKWQQVAARGDTARGFALVLPHDVDQNGIADAWQDEFKVTERTADADSLPAGKHVGDGLSNFEEYRGVYSGGTHFRMNPNQKDIFMHAYKRTDYDFPIAEVSRRLAKQQLNLYPLTHDEFEGEVINFESYAEDRRTRQYISIIQDSATMNDGGMTGLDMETGVDVGLAAVTHPGPLRRDFNTILISSGKPSSPGGAPTVVANAWAFIGHELGHQLGIKHHGDGDQMVPVADLLAKDIYVSNGDRHHKKLSVAVSGGQHSGDPKCFMSYHAARYRLHETQGIIRWNRLTVDHEHFCNDDRGQEYNKEVGTGAADRGNCLSQINVPTPQDEAPKILHRNVVPGP